MQPQHIATAVELFGGSEVDPVPNPYPTYKRLRDAGPPSQMQTLMSASYLVTRYDDVRTMLSNEAYGECGRCGEWMYSSLMKGGMCPTCSVLQMAQEADERERLAPGCKPFVDAQTVKKSRQDAKQRQVLEMAMRDQKIF